jgi:hypothetical protein
MNNFLTVHTGAWGIPAYTMQGLNAEVNKMFGRSLQNYITASRVAQGRGDVLSATPEEKDDVVLRWNAMKEDLKPFYNMKEGRHRLSHRHSGKGKGLDDTESAFSESDTPRTGFWNTRHMSFDERKKLHAQKAAKKQQQKTAGTSTPRTADSSSVYSMSSEDAELEQAIRESVKETSRGNPEEDVMVEAAIRASIRAMREKDISIPQPEQVQAPPEKDPSIFKDPEYQVTDEQYQALVEQALQRSVEGHSQATHAPSSGKDDNELKRAIEASMADAQKQNSQRTEEDIVMEYVKKQSLAEEEFREKHSGAAPSGKADETTEDEDLKKAMEESLQMSHNGGGGPSGT